MATADADDCGDEFVGYNEWATSTLGVHLCTDFVYDYDGGERGVFVAEDIAPQTCVVSVPFTALLTLEWLRAQAASGHPVYSKVALFHSLLQPSWDAEREDDALAMALLYERFVAAEQSKWHPHLALLPSSYDNLLYWSHSELAHLRGSNVFAIARQMRLKLQQDYDHLKANTIPELVAAVHKSGAARDIQAHFSLEMYQWALSTIWSRFVSVEKGESVLKAMAPVFDMLNHDPEADVTHRFNATTGCLEVTTHDHVSAGTQLFIHYGALSNQRLLTLYGFVVADNPFDTVEMWMCMDPETTPLFERKAKTLVDLGIDHGSMAYELCGGDDGVDDVLLLAARVMALEKADELEWEQRIDTIKSGRVVSKDHEMRALSLLLYRVQQLLSEYAHHEEQPRSNTGDESRLSMARTVCESDQKILRETITDLELRLMALLR